MVSFKRPLLSALFACVFAVSALHALGRVNPEDEARIKETGNCASCSLVDANLQGVNAENGDLSSADFTGANLYMANLRGANVEGANFNGANLAGAQLLGAIGANLGGATTDERTQCPGGQAGPCR